MEHVTHESLLVRLQDVQDGQAWERFHQYYRTFVLNFACNRGCTEAMAQDVLQETMITLTKVMPRFRYDRLRGKFRTFLLTIVSSRIVDAFRREKKHRTHTTAADDETEQARTIADDWISQWESDWEREWQQHLLMQALERVRLRVKPAIFESFQMYVLEQRPATAVTEALGIPENTIYQHRRRVVAMLQQEVAALRAELGEEP